MFHIVTRFYNYGVTPVNMVIQGVRGCYILLHTCSATGCYMVLHSVTTTTT